MVDSSVKTKHSEKIYVFPTDTVWGIGGSVFSREAFLEVARLKKTSPDKPVSILFSHCRQISEYFTLPSGYSEAFLEKFFSLESTLGLNKEWILDEKIPSWIYQQSHFVGVRCLNFPWVEEVVREAGGPVVTTSLNVTGEEPASTYEEALEFVRTHGRGANLVFPQSCPKDFLVSGNSSSIVFYRPEEAQLHFLREGTLAPEIKAHFGLLST